METILIKAINSEVGLFALDLNILIHYSMIVEFIEPTESHELLATANQHPIRGPTINWGL